MCEFCHQHGEGKRWYLKAKNYSEDLLGDLKRRHYIKEFFSNPEKMLKGQHWLRMLQKMPPFIRGAIKRGLSKHQKKIHYGQVVPLGEVEKIFSLVNSIVRINCYCRQTTTPPLERNRQRYCYGLSMGIGGGELAKIIGEVDSSYLQGPDTSKLEVLSKEEALAAFRDHEEEGLCHTIWTFHTPFIGGICNCNLHDCYALKTTLTHKTRVLMAGEYQAYIQKHLCSGCGRCLLICPFNALQRVLGGKVKVKSNLCYGCGLCGTHCPIGASNLYRKGMVPFT